MARIMMYVTIIITIGVLGGLFGLTTDSFSIWDTLFEITQDAGGFILEGFTDGSFWTTVRSIMTVLGVGAVFIGTAFKIPLELIALIPLGLLLLGLSGDLWAIYTKVGTLCPSFAAQLGCFMEPIVFLLSAVLFVGYIITVISWWAGRNA